MAENLNNSEYFVGLGQRKKFTPSATKSFLAVKHCIRFGGNSHQIMSQILLRDLKRGKLLGWEVGVLPAEKGLSLVTLARGVLMDTLQRLNMHQRRHLT
jgi:hypothetical protein